MFNEIDTAFVLLLLLALLLSIGLVAVYTSTIASSETEIENSYIWQHGVSLLLSVAMASALLLVPLRVLRENSLLLVIALCVLLVLVHIPGISAGDQKGAIRRIDLIYFTLQPAELAKPILLVYICSFLARLEQHRKTIKDYLPIFFISAIVISPIVAQSDFGTTLLLAATLLSMLLITRTRALVTVSVLIVVCFGAILLVVLVDYRIDRVIGVWMQEHLAYQQQQAKFAFALGGLFGRGIGMSSRKWSGLPEAKSDSIIAIIAEEIGFFGFVALLLLYSAIVLICFNAAKAASRRGDLFQSLLAKGIAILLSMQVFIHIAGNMALIPFKGLTLPLISLGGSSILAWMCSFSLLFQIIRENCEYRRECKTAIGGVADD